MKNLMKICVNLLYKQNKLQNNAQNGGIII